MRAGRLSDIFRPFVATLVDVTGLIIYFSIALVIMRDVSSRYSAVASAVPSG
jgi:hypothetical protein